MHIPKHGDRKLGSVLDYGAAELVNAVKSLTSLPIHHYIEVNFEGFIGLVDAFGGIDLFIERPIRDAKMHLNLPQALSISTAIQQCYLPALEASRNA